MERSGLNNVKIGEDSSEVAVHSCDDQYLPTEIWYEIFRHLPAKQLLSIRLTCRRWKDIVDDRSLLRNAATVTFPLDTEVDGDYEPEGLLPASGARFKKSWILELGTWWSSFAADLIELEINSCTVIFQTFAEMLRVAPNLRSLTLVDADFIGITVNAPNFQLNKVLDLSISEVSIDFLSVFAGVFPNLKSLTFSCERNEVDNQNQKLVQFVQSVQDTLEDLGPCYDIDSLTAISKLPRLKLRNLTCSFRSGATTRLVEICRLQPLIEHLDLGYMRITNTTLCEIGMNLRNLKHICIRIGQRGESIEASFLRTMPKMEHLRVEGTTRYQMVDFSKCRNHHLEHLDLYNIHQTQTSWNFLNHSPNILEINIHSCHFDSWSDLFMPINQLKFLQRLFLTDVEIRSNTTNFTLEPWNNLNLLRIRNCSPDKSVLLELFQNCPQLRYLYLRKLSTLDDETVLLLCQKLKYLHCLSIKGYPLSNDIAQWCEVNSVIIK